MRIASYNLYQGAADTYDELNRFVEREDPDVLCLQEVNGWDKVDGDDRNPRYYNFATNAQYDSVAYGKSNTPYDLAIYSRATESSQTYRKEFWHAVLHSQLRQPGGQHLHVWNVHLNPNTEEQRLQEVRKLISLADTDEDTIITGDFNSLSRADNYGDELVAILASQGITKFGTDELMYGVTDRLAYAGYVDVAAYLDNIETTVPTAANRDMYHAAPMRLDYMFVSRTLMDRVRDFQVIRDPLTEKISDHYPVVLTID